MMHLDRAARQTVQQQRAGPAFARFASYGGLARRLLNWTHGLFELNELVCETGS
jgi:hypothetical protein